MERTKPVSLKNYRIAKDYIRDGETILKILNLSMQGLGVFTKYKPVANLISDMHNARAILEAHMNTAKKIVGEAKGEDGGKQET